MSAWSRVPRLGAPVVVRQRDELSCGPACGEMLLADRGIHRDQELIAVELALPVDGPALAARLNALSSIRWLGGALDLPEEPDWTLITQLSELKGSWAALLEPHGPAHVGHWVVVDGVNQEVVVLVRDPVGMAYGIPIEEFLSLWRYTVLVMEDRRP